MALKNRYEYLKDFVVDTDGKYIYAGTTYTLDLERAGKSRFQVLGIPALLSALGLAASITGGLIPAPYMNGHAAVVLGYAAALIGSSMMAICAFRILFSKDPVRDYNYRETVQKLVPNAWISMLGFGVSLIAYLYFLIRYGLGDPRWGSIVFLFSELTGCAAAYMVAKLGKELPYREHPGKNRQEAEKETADLPDPDDYRVI